ncbi:putative Heat shock protein Hsp90 family [Helianthus anomalus]
MGTLNLELGKLTFDQPYSFNGEIPRFMLSDNNLRLVGDTDEVKERENKQEYIALCDRMKQQLGDKVVKVQISNRLSSSPCVLVSGKFGLY